MINFMFSFTLNLFIIISLKNEVGLDATRHV